MQRADCNVCVDRELVASLPSPSLPCCSHSGDRGACPPSLPPAALRAKSLPSHPSRSVWLSSEPRIPCRPAVLRRPSFNPEPILSSLVSLLPLRCPLNAELTLCTNARRSLHHGRLPALCPYCSSWRSPLTSLPPPSHLSPLYSFVYPPPPLSSQSSLFAVEAALAAAVADHSSSDCT